MPKFTKLGLAVLTSSLLLAGAVSTASARSFSISNLNIRATWSRLEFTSALATVRCPVTIEGSYHARTIAKTIGNLKGAVGRVTIKNESCTNGTIAVESLPWHWSQEGFTGTLPNITATKLLLTRRRFTVTALGVRCTYGNETDRITFTSALNASGQVTSFSPDAGNVVHRVEGGAFCPETGSLAGPEGIMTAAGTNARLTVTLI